MKAFVSTLFAATLLFAAEGAWAAQRSVTLTVDNMTCASCPYIVKKTLAGVAGVEKVAVSFEQKTATVTFDDAKTTTAALAEASTQAGFPAKPLP
jgi:mercuric ion binding protein